MTHHTMSEHSTSELCPASPQPNKCVGFLAQGNKSMGLLAQGNKCMGLLAQGNKCVGLLV